MAPLQKKSAGIAYELAKEICLWGIYPAQTSKKKTIERCREAFVRMEKLFGDDAGRIVLEYAFNHSIFPNVAVIYLAKRSLPKSLKALDAVRPESFFEEGIIVNTTMERLVKKAKDTNSPYVEDIKRAWGKKIHDLFKASICKPRPELLCVHHLLKASLSGGFFYLLDDEVHRKMRQAIFEWLHIPHTMMHGIIYWLCLEGDGALRMYEVFNTLAEKDKKLLVSFIRKDTIRLRENYEGIGERIASILSRGMHGHPLHDALTEFCLGYLKS